MVPGTDQTIWLNIGESDRANDFLARRAAQGMSDVRLHSFDIDADFLHYLQSEAVPEQVAASFPSRPIISRDPFPNQFGIRPDQYQRLLDSIRPGSGTVVRH